MKITESSLKRGTLGPESHSDGGYLWFNFHRFWSVRSVSQAEIALFCNIFFTDKRIVDYFSSPQF
jgi:hypothetical protein